MATTWFEHWKGVIGSAAAGLVVILQLIQLLLAIGIENTLDDKTEQLRIKTDALTVLLNANGDISRGNQKLLEDNRKRAEEALTHVIAIEKELQILEISDRQQVTDHKQMLQEFQEKLQQLRQEQH